MCLTGRDGILISVSLRTKNHWLHHSSTKKLHALNCSLRALCILSNAKKWIKNEFQQKPAHRIWRQPDEFIQINTRHSDAHRSRWILYLSGVARGTNRRECLAHNNNWMQTIWWQFSVVAGISNNCHVTIADLFLLLSSNLLFNMIRIYLYEILLVHPIRTFVTDISMDFACETVEMSFGWQF